MKKLLLIVPWIAFTAGCAVPIQSVASGYPGGYSGPYGQGPIYPRTMGPQVNLASLPLGRWDNVMMSAVGTRLLVLMKTGNIASGDVVSATSESLRLRVASGEVDLAAAEVMRVDRLQPGTRDAVKDGVRGAAFGAAAVGVLGLIVGHVPPARLFAAGGIIGAEQNIELARLVKGATTIYLAEEAVPARATTAPQPVQRMGPGGPCGPGNPTCNSQIRYSKYRR